MAWQSEQLSKELLEANTENAWLASELMKANETITTLDTNVAIERKEGFNKAMRQATFLLKVDPIAVGFKIDQDVFSGEMRLVVEVEDAEDVEDADGGEGVVSNVLMPVKAGRGTMNNVLFSFINVFVVFLVQ